MTGSQDHDRGEPSAQELGHAGPQSGTVLRVALKRRSDFVAAARGRRAHARTMTLQIFRRPDDGLANPRFGLTVTKKVGGSVERNRIKRRLREALRAPGLAPQAGHDYVIVARRDALTLPFTTLVADLTKLLDQARHGRPSQGGRTPFGRDLAPSGRDRTRLAGDGRTARPPDA